MTGERADDIKRTSEQIVQLYKMISWEENEKMSVGMERMAPTRINKHQT